MPIRDLQVFLAEVGRIRLGRKDPDKRFPDRHETFRLTSRDEALVNAAAELYGGKPGPWTPQGDGPPQFEVLTRATVLPVYVPRQNIDPWLEQWGKGVCKRRCDGAVEQKTGDACLCDAEKLADKDPNRCKPTVRVQLMLAELPGLTTWRLDSHGRYACGQLAQLAPLFASVPMPVPAKLTLTKISQRVWDPAERKVNALDRWVPAIIIDAVTSQQLAVGGDALTQALSAAGGVTALSTGGRERLAIGGAPPAPAPAVPKPAELPDEERNRILKAIETKTTVAELDAMKEALFKRDIRDKAVQDAWYSKYKSIAAALKVGGSAPGGRAEPSPDVVTATDMLVNPEGYQVGDTVTVGGVHFTKVAESPFDEQVTLDTSGLPHGGVVDGTVVEPVPLSPGTEVVADYDTSDQYMQVVAMLPGKTTAEVNALVRQFCNVERTQDATGAQLHDMVAAMRRKAAAQQ